MKDTKKKPVTPPVKSDPCVKPFDPENQRLGDEDDACVDGERPPSYRKEIEKSVKGKPAR